MKQHHFPIYKSFWIDPNHHKEFKSRQLVSSWATSYPFLFDEKDQEIAQNQAHLGYHYYEWLAAILVFHTEGLLSLVEKYQFNSHKSKAKILQRLAPSETIEFIRKHPEFGRAQCPDLLVYEPDFSDWFFLEVKGPKDELSTTQIAFFEKLIQVSGKTVRTLEFKSNRH